MFDQKMPLDERRALIRQRFPSTASLQWERVFTNDIELLGRILRDILKIELTSNPGRPGPRPGLDRTEAEPVLDKLLGRDPTDRPYTLLPFPEALRLLMGERSLRHFQAKVGMSKSHLHRLLQGTEKPTVEDMEHIARVFGKLPSYFPEYRLARIAAAINEHLQEDPDVSIRVYERLAHAAAR